MKRIVLASTQPGAGKTSLALGIAHALEKRPGYLKPLGDRPLYRKKRLWDADCSVASLELGLGDDPAALCLGLAHSKIRFMHQPAALPAKLREMAENMEQNGRAPLLVEAGSTLAAGAAIGLDPLSLATSLDAALFVVLTGENDTMADQATFLARLLDSFPGTFGGLIVNGVRDREDFEIACLPSLEATGLPLAGTLPYRHELAAPTAAAIADQLPALIVAGKPSARRPIGRIFLGALPATGAHKSDAFLSRNKLVVTTADHTDLILAALESDTAAILLAGEDLPHASILAQAEEKDVPILSVHEDLLSLAGRLQKLEPKLTAGDHERFAILASLVQEHLDLPEILPPATQPGKA